MIDFARPTRRHVRAQFSVVELWDHRTHDKQNIYPRSFQHGTKSVPCQSYQYPLIGSIPETPHELFARAIYISDQILHETETINLLAENWLMHGMHRSEAFGRDETHLEERKLKVKTKRGIKYLWGDTSRVASLLAWGCATLCTQRNEFVTKQLEWTQWAGVWSYFAAKGQDADAISPTLLLQRTLVVVVVLVLTRVRYRGPWTGQTLCTWVLRTIVCQVRLFTELMESREVIHPEPEMAGTTSSNRTEVAQSGVQMQPDISTFAAIFTDDRSKDSVSEDTISGKPFPTEPDVFQFVQTPKTTANHTYRIFSTIPPDPTYQIPVLIDQMNFHEKLYCLLSLDIETRQDTIKWCFGGRAFFIPDVGLLLRAMLLKHFFGHNNLQRFRKQLNDFGYKRLTQEESNYGSDCYYSEVSKCSTVLSKNMRIDNISCFQSSVPTSQSSSCTAI